MLLDDWVSGRINKCACTAWNGVQRIAIPGILDNIWRNTEPVFEVRNADDKDYVIA